LRRFGSRIKSSQKWICRSAALTHAFEALEPAILDKGLDRADVDDTGVQLGTPGWIESRIDAIGHRRSRLFCTRA